MVGTEAFIDKPVALFNASPVSTYAPVALREILSVMSARIIDPACIDVWIRGSKLDESGIVSHPEISSTISCALIELRNALA